MAQHSAGHLNKIGLPAIQRSSAVQTRDFDAEPRPVTAALRGLFGNLPATATESKNQPSARLFIPSRRRKAMASCFHGIESFFPGCLVQEPGAPLGFVDPILQQACSGNIAMLIGKTVGFAHVSRQLLVVVTQLGEHIHWSDKIGVVVLDPLQTGEIERIVVPPILRARSAISSVVAKI